jgi:hypothetical protein
MEIKFKKGNSKDVMVCTREDGSSTWTQTDRFMTVHDLTHFCVESELGMRSGFYGLLAEGLNITDFENKVKIQARDLPQESIVAELIVGLLLTERSDGQPLADFNHVLQQMVTHNHLSLSIILTDVQLKNIRSRLNDLLGRWMTLDCDQALNLNFKSK